MVSTKVWRLAIHWWLFYKNESSRRVPQPRKSSEQCRKRTWDVCHTRWNDPGKAGSRLRNDWPLKAKSLNKQTSQDLACQQREDTEQITQPQQSEKLVARLQVYKGSGPFGLGGTSFALSVNTVKQADADTKSCVKTFADSWASRTCENQETFYYLVCKILDYVVQNFCITKTSLLLCWQIYANLLQTIGRSMWSVARMEGHHFIFLSHCFFRAQRILT